MEIERKFLIDREDLPGNLASYPCHRIEQGYLCVSPVVRIRRSDEEYYMTYKSGGLLSREEYNLPLTKEAYLHLKEKTDGILISKTRYLIPEKDGLTIELDVFGAPYEGLFMAEVEFASEEQALAYEPPAWFSKDVTQAGLYQNSSLSRGVSLEKLLGKEAGEEKREEGGEMSTKVYLFLADGFEDIEALTVVDMMRRAGIEIQTVSIMGRREVTTSHAVTVLADCLFEEAEPLIKKEDLLVLPGGQPGTTHLGECAPLCDLLVRHEGEGGRLAAICAAPTVLNRLGLLEGRKATSYPATEPAMDRVGAYLKDSVVVDGLVTTSRGMGTAIDFSLSLIASLKDEETARKLACSIVYRRG